MANELKHVSVGVQLTQAEYESVTGHQFDSQATGDVLYASSATQLSRLAIGGANAVLIVSGGIPAWATTLAGLTLTAPTINGTVATTGLTLPGFTLGGTVTAGGNVIAGQGMATYNSGTGIRGAAADGRIFIIAGPSNSFDSYIEMRGSSYAGTPGQMLLYTTGAAADNVLRLTMGAGAAVVPFTWNAVNHLFGTNYTEYTEMAAPGAGAANTARIYALEGAGDTLTDLCAVFQDGSIAVFAQETTPLDSPRFAYPDNTEVKVVLRKPHPGVVRFVAVFPDGKEEVLNETLYTDTERVAANKGARAALPAGWKLETQAQRNARAVDLEAARVATLSRE